LVVSIVVSVGAGVAFNVSTTLTGWPGVAAGLAVFIATELLWLLLDADEARSVDNAIIAIAKAFRTGGYFSDFFAVQVISHLREAANRCVTDGIDIPAEDVPRLWTECVAHAERSIQATTYVKISKWWDKSYARINSEIRRLKARQKKAVSILFLWDTPDELAEFKRIADEQSADGVVVSHADIQTIKGDSTRMSHLSVIGTPDFGVIDGQWAFLHFLDDTRGTVSARLTDNEKIVHACLELLRLTEGTTDFAAAGSSARP
jgi:hypothetical protein